MNPTLTAVKDMIFQSLSIAFTGQFFHWISIRCLSIWFRTNPFTYIWRCRFILVALFPLCKHVIQCTHYVSGYVWLGYLGVFKSRVIDYMAWTKHIQNTLTWRIQIANLYVSSHNDMAQSSLWYGANERATERSVWRRDERFISIRIERSS